MESGYLYPTRLFYPVTYVDETHPEQQRALGGHRHKLSHAIHDFFVPDSVTQTPRADIRETSTKYYIDVELAGLKSTNDLTIQWTNPRALLVRADVKRTLTGEEPSAAAQQNDEQKSNKAGRSVHYLKTERVVGTMMRAFEFVVDVDHDSLKAELQNGLLTMVIDKKPGEDVKGKAVKVVQS